MAADPNPEVAAVLKWRTALQVETGAARASAARLRRASSVLDALLLEETQDLLRRAHQAAPKATVPERDRRLVVLAMTLPRIEGESKTSLARALGQTSADRTPSGEERPRLSPARFGALARAARTRDWDGFARALRRALAILGDAPIDVARLARDVLALDDETLIRWTYDYWQTLQPPETANFQPDDAEEMEDAR
jgi:CRISPR type I-E-associated protein CasB/Cse2